MVLLKPLLPGIEGDSEAISGFAAVVLIHSNCRDISNFDSSFPRA
jgi:hypothetical protein